MSSFGRLCLTLVAWGWLTGSVAFAVPGVPESGILEFSVTRSGDRIGRQIYRFKRVDDQMEVVVQTDIDYRILFLPVYRFRHEALEVWQDGQLTSLTSSTNDNGEWLSLDVRLQEGELMAVKPGGAEAMPADAVPASLWNPAVLDRGILFDPVRGAVMRTEMDHLGEETLIVGGEPVATRHYRLSGEYRRDLWYDRNSGVLVRVRLQARDGSVVEYRRDR